MGRRLVGILIPIAIQIGFAAATLSRLPARIATHFDIHGAANGWMSASGYLMIIAFEAVVLNLSLFGVAAYMAGSQSLDWINVPWKGYWKQTPERSRDCIARMVRFLQGGAWGANLLIFGGQLLVLSKNGVELPIAISANTFVIGTFGWVVLYFIWMVRLFKPPRES